jgi:hypothetical protein
MQVAIRPSAQGVLITTVFIVISASEAGATARFARPREPPAALRASVRRHRSRLIRGGFGRSDRSRLVPRDDITADQRGAMVRNGLTSPFPLPCHDWGHFSVGFTHPTKVGRGVRG